MHRALRASALRWRRLLVIALVAAIFVTGIALPAVLSRTMMSEGARTLLDNAAPAARALTVQYSRLASSEDSDEKFQAALTSAIRDAPVSLALHSHLRLDATLAGKTEKVWIVAGDDLTDLATLTDGAWPAATDETVVNAASDVPIGTELTVDGTVLRVVGTFTARDDADPVWLADPATSAGVSTDGRGPFLITEATRASISESFSAAWTMTPTHLDVTQVGAVSGALTRVPRVVAELDSSGSLSARATGDLQATLTRISAATATTTAIAAIPLVIVVILGALVLWLLTTELGRSRREELMLLRARGASGRRLFTTAAIESAIVTLLGGAVGVGVVTLWRGTFEALLIAAFAVLLAAIAAGIAAVRAARPAAGIRDSARAAVLSWVLPGVLVAAAAGLTSWQLFSRRTFAVGGELDYAALAAPALLVVLGGMLVALLGIALASVAAGIASRGRGIASVLALRRSSRGARTLMAGVLSLALAAGTAVLGGAVVTATNEAQQQIEQRSLGGDVRVVLGQSVQPADRSVAPLEGATATPVLIAAAAIGASKEQLVAADPTWLVSASQAEKLRTAGELPASSPTVTVTFTGTDTGAGEENVTGFDGTEYTIVLPPSTVKTRVRTVTGQGITDSHTLEQWVADGTPHTATLTLGESERIVAAEVTLVPNPNNWAPHVLGTVAITGAGSSLDSDMDVDLQPEARTATAVVDGVPTTLPIVATKAWAQDVGIAVGDTTAISAPSISPRIPVTLTAIVDEIPGMGSAPAAAADLTTLQQLALATGASDPMVTEWWLTGADPAKLARDVRSTLTVPAQVLTAASVSSAPITNIGTWAVIMGVAAAALLAAVAFISVAGESLRARSAEVIPLRAVGMTPALNRRASALEFGGAALFSLAFGVGVGYLVARVIVPVFTGAIS